MRINLVWTTAPAQNRVEGSRTSSCIVKWCICEIRNRYWAGCIGRQWNIKAFFVGLKNIWDLNYRWVSVGIG